MKLLITGGAGFIGSHLIERLVARGDKVVVVDDFNDYYDPRIKNRNLSSALGSSSVVLRKGDVRDIEFITNVCSEQPFDVIVHLAARVGVRPSLREPFLYLDVNCRGTLNMLEMARRFKIAHFVFASSSSVYGGSGPPPFREDMKIDRPLSPYAATKAAGELLCYDYHHLYGMSVNALRFFTAYGPRQRPDMAIHKFTAMIDRGEPIPFFGDGTSARDYTYYTDIIDGVVAAIDRRFGFEAFNLGEEATTTLDKLVAVIERNLGRKAVRETLPMQQGDMTATCADVSKAKRLLGYRPSVLIEEGVKKFVDWYKANKAL